MKIIKQSRSSALRWRAQLEAELDQAEAIFVEDGPERTEIYRVPYKKKAKLLMVIEEWEEGSK